MATLNLGKISLNWRGAFAASTVYSKNDAVSSGGSSWIAIIDQTAPAFDNTVTYSLNDLVTDGGNVFRYINATAAAGNATSVTTHWAANTPSSTNTTFWNLIADGASPLTTQGDILTHDGTSSIRLARGNSGDVVTVSGSDIAFAPQKGYEGHKFLQTNYADTIADPTASTDYGKNGKYPWLADYSNNWVPTCGFPNPSCGPVPWAEHGSQYIYRMTIYLNTNHEVVVFGDDDFYWFGTSTGQKHDQGAVINFNSEFGGMRDGEYPVRFWVMYNNIWLLTSEGNLFSAGDNAYGQLGVGGTTDRYSFTKIATLGPDATHGGTSCQIAGFYVGNQTDNGAANYGSCYAIDTSGRLFVWGYNGGGKLGIGNTTNQSYPVLVSGVSNVKSVSAGMESTYVVDASGNLFIAGDNQNGVCGGINSTSFTDSGQNNVYQVINGDGYYHTTRYAHGHYLNTSGELYGVGGNAVGSVGDGTLVQKGSWTRIGGSATYSSFYYAGNSYYLTVGALGGTPNNSNDDFFAWGYNVNGQVGDGTVTNVQSPTQPTTTTLYTHTTTSTTSNTAPTETDVPLPVNDIKKVWGTRGAQGQGTSEFFLMDNKYRIWQGGYSQSEDYNQTSTGNTPLNNYRLDIGPWSTTSAITTSHWAGKTEEQVVHIHGLGNAYGSEGHVVFMTTAGRIFGKRYNTQGQLESGLNYIGNWIQLTP